VTTAPSRSERQRLRLPLATAALGASVLLPARLSGARAIIEREHKTGP
jgi:hypothetical protein